MSGSPDDAANCVDGTHCIAGRSSTPGRCCSVTLDEAITKSRLLEPDSCFHPDPVKGRVIGMGVFKIDDTDLASIP